jgi:anhydro-N-acetylmuramic acid kinase
MHPSLIRLTEMAKRDYRMILGLMSGTSLDGLDLALCKIEGFGKTTQLTCLQHTTIPYSKAMKSELKSIYAQHEMDARKICTLNVTVAETHAAMVLQCFYEWGIDTHQIDLIASHGQTIFHFPKEHKDNLTGKTMTWQLGDGDILAVKTGIITISDFRQKNLAAGGEGAPLAAYGDYILFNDKEHDRILLNLGGIANLTYLPKGGKFDSITCTDLGPANGLMDRWVSKHWPDFTFDTEGALAAQGKVIDRLLLALSKHSFFEIPFPKSIGPELFNEHYIESALRVCNENYNAVDVLATLNRWTALLVSDAIQKICNKNGTTEVFVSGGGYHNQTLMKSIRSLLPSNYIFNEIAIAGISPDAKEGILFAVLANECIFGTNIFEPGKASHPSISMGKISLPR